MKKTLVIVMMVMAAVGVLAQESAKAEKKKNEIVVTAVRGKSEAAKAPSNVTVIDSDDIRLKKANSVAEALKNVEGIIVRGITENPALRQVSMRGFVENAQGRLLVLVDSQRLNNPNMSSINWLQVPVGDIDRIEVVRGASSALYGNQAIAGVINIITKKGAERAAAEVKVEGGSDGLLNVSAGASGVKDNLHYRVSAERHQSDGYRDNSEYDSDGAGVSLGYDITDSYNIDVSFFWQQDDYQLPGYLSKEKMDEDPTQSIFDDDRADNEYSIISAVLKGETADGDKVNVHTSFRRKDSSMDMASWYSYADTVMDSTKLMPQYVYNGSIGEMDNMLIVGIDYSLDTLDVDRFSDISRSMADINAEIKMDIIGGYLRDELCFQDNAVLGIGARVERAKVSADVRSASGIIDDNTSHNENAFDLSIMQLANDGKTKLYVRGSTVYRYPFVDEQVSYIGFGSDEFYSDIDPEEGWVLEAGVEGEIADGLTAGLTAFIINMKDEIAWNGVTMRNENLDKTRREGIEIDVSYSSLDSVLLYGNYTFMELAEFISGEYDGNDIPLVPTHKITLGATFELPADTLIDANVSYIDESYLGGDKDNTGDKLDSYIVTDIYIMHKIKAVEGLEVYAGVNNLFDEEYASLAYKGFMEDGYYPSAGRTYKAGLAYKY